jgi:5-methylcytosine-specific restriction endonuclease McrA
MATKQQKDQAWENAQKIRGKNPNLWRRDDFGNPIYKPAYGTNGKYGWEVDHKHPVSRGGSDRADNLRALNTIVNREKGKKYPYEG